MARQRNGWLKYHGSSYGMPWLLGYEYTVDTAIEFPSVKAEFYLRDQLRRLRSVPAQLCLVRQEQETSWCPKWISKVTLGETLGGVEISRQG